MTTELAIRDSLHEMKNSLSMDLQMIRNYRSLLVKQQQLEKVDTLKDIESGIDGLMNVIDEALNR